MIALTIDEDGMALTADKKVAIAKRIYKLATEKYGLRRMDLIFDALTLPISTGQEDYRTAGMETLEAVKRIKQELPEVKTILGVSNISFGLDAYPRRVLNSVFMHEAVNNGLDMAIVNYAKIYPLYKIPQEEVELARKLIYRDAASDGDPLQKYMQHFAGNKGQRRERDHRACRNSFGRGQAEVRHHQWRKGGRRRRAQEDPGRNTGRSARPIFSARPDQQRAARRDDARWAICLARARCSCRRCSIPRA